MHMRRSGGAAQAKDLPSGHPARPIGGAGSEHHHHQQQQQQQQQQEKQQQQQQQYQQQQQQSGAENRVPRWTGPSTGAQDQGANIRRSSGGTVYVAGGTVYAGAPKGTILRADDGKAPPRSRSRTPRGSDQSSGDNVGGSGHRQAPNPPISWEASGGAVKADSVASSSRGRRLPAEASAPAASAASAAWASASAPSAPQSRSLNLYGPSKNNTSNNSNNNNDDSANVLLRQSPGPSPGERSLTGAEAGRAWRPEPPTRPVPGSTRSRVVDTAKELEKLRVQLAKLQRGREVVPPAAGSPGNNSGVDQAVRPAVDNLSHGRGSKAASPVVPAAAGSNSGPGVSKAPAMAALPLTASSALAVGGSKVTLTLATPPLTASS
ncbi:unnamed protein product, partial [Polarella glacialis]